ncbi:hypothetical protein ABGB17_35545 [Sphaerisporangium sp. B11E5]|uniref:hypothetical protein n=1 Tax=Sphaerisporangium sp. B11E5 TaxID=3153563 RepID=UPI00325F130E
MRKGTTVLSAGALTLALSGGAALLVTAPAFASAPRVAGCEWLAPGEGRCDPAPAAGPGGGLLDPIGTVGDLVEDADRVLGGLRQSADDVLGGKPSAKPEQKEKGNPHGDSSPPGNRGEPSGPPDTGSDPDDRTDHQADPLPEDDADPGDDLLDLPTGCLPLLGCDETTDTPAPSPPAGRDRSTPAPTARPRATPSGGRESSPPATPEATPAPGLPAPPGGDRDGRLERAFSAEAPRHAADIDAQPLAPLWPGQPLPELADPLAAGKVVVPTRSDDAAGTVLTAILLASAIIAARVVHTRQARRGAEAAATIPLQGLHRPDTGRHRLA